jgi:hypothetical protein
MPDPLTTPQKPMPRTLLAAGTLVLGLGLLVGLTPASAAPIKPLSGLSGPGLQIDEAAYRRKKYRSYYADQQVYVPNNYGTPSYYKERYMPYGGSDEILELQRRYPQTNWPPSMRYF